MSDEYYDFRNDGTCLDYLRVLSGCGLIGTTVACFDKSLVLLCCAGVFLGTTGGIAAGNNYVHARRALGKKDNTGCYGFWSLFSTEENAEIKQFNDCVISNTCLICLAGANIFGTINYPIIYWAAIGINGGDAVARTAQMVESSYHCCSEAQGEEEFKSLTREENKEEDGDVSPDEMTDHQAARFLCGLPLPKCC